ncbi:MAG: putative transposase [Pseudomonadota bacterium]
MAIQTRLPFHPAEAVEVNETVSFKDDGKSIGYFAGGVPVFAHEHGDLVGQRVAVTQMIALGLAKQNELGAALGVARTTLYRQQQRLKISGVAGLVDEKPGPKAPHKLKGETLEFAQRMLDAGKSKNATAKTVGVNESTIRHAIARGRLHEKPEKPRAERGSRKGSQPSERNAEGASAPLGVATTRVLDRVLAARGKLVEAAPEFEPSSSVTNAGALVALPAMLELGLLDVGEKVYGSLRNGFYGLRSTLLCLGFMALLRIRNPERMQFEAPGELGVLLGLDRAPETKTVRRKLAELAERGQATRLSAGLAERWVRQTPRALGYLYFDGHVRAYHGQKHRLTKTHVARRRLCMPATTDYWVNDKNAEPLFFVTGELNERLIASMKARVLPEVRRLAGKRRVTLIFDREGWSPKWFAELYEAGFDVLTYRRGKYDPWPGKMFETVKGTVEGRELSYELAEKTVRVLPGFKMREVRRLRQGGRQTAVMTTRWNTRAIELAWRMFERWRQENFFRYMREHFALDALASRRVEPVGEEKTIPHPKRAKLGKKLAKLKAALAKLEKDYGARAFENEESSRPTARGFKIANGKLGREIRALRSKCARLKVRIKALPERVAAPKAEGEPIVKLDPETKHLTDAIKMVAYRAETALVGMLNDEAYARTEEEGRALVREILRAPADVLPDDDAGLLRVRLHGLANPRSNAALRHLCAALNEAQVSYPGTRLRLRYEAPNDASILSTDQES